LMSWITMSFEPTSVLFSKIKQSHKILSELITSKMIIFDKMTVSQRCKIEIQPNFSQNSLAYAQRVER
jgi:hypothetical protein